MLLKNNDLSNIKLIDFGLSKELENSYKDHLSLYDGTPFYLAPEAINKSLSPASDVWSLGIVMYICLAGKLPFSGSSTSDIV